MREIKFRVWDIRNNEMIYGAHESYHWHGYLGLPEYYELMQYTGLKDKNGKEIYEGDILKNQVSELSVVKWQGIGWNPFVDSMIDHYKSYRFEIIGNIYENPELLEDK